MTIQIDKQPIYAWHFTDGWKLRDDQPLVIGKTYHVDGPLKICNHGLHASIKIMDALHYAPGNIVSYVECSGDIIFDDEKLVCRNRKVIAALDIKRQLHESACEFAIAALLLADADIPESWNAIETKYAWLDGYATDQKLAAAKDAAWAAARNAAWVAAKDAA